MLYVQYTFLLTSGAAAIRGGGETPVRGRDIITTAWHAGHQPGGVQSTHNTGQPTS